MTFLIEGGRRRGAGGEEEGDEEGEGEGREERERGGEGR
jgi:hypothetical protein